MTEQYTVSVFDADRRRRRPLAVHAGLTVGEAFERASVYRALNHSGEHIAIERVATRRKDKAW